MINWGIIGAGRIAHRFAEGLSFESTASLLAISGRNQEKLEEFAKVYPCKKIYTDYQQIIDDEEIDAVYISLPNKYHYQWAKKAVMCEKPAMIDLTQTKQIINIAKENKTLFMEAMKPRFVPMYHTILDIIKIKTIGEIEQIETEICFKLPNLNENISYLDQQTGGCLRDSGIYCASL